MIRIQTAVSVILAGASLLLSGCSGPGTGARNSPTATTEGQSAQPIKTVKPTRNTIERTINQPGFVQAFEQTPIYSKIAGYVDALNVDIGSRVSKGQVLAELRVPELEVEVAQKKALVSQAEAEVKQAIEALAVAGADLKSAAAKVSAADAARLRARAQLERAGSVYQRLKAAGSNGVIGKEDVEEARLGMETAKAGIEEVNAQIRSAQADRDASQAKQGKAEADAQVARSHLEVAKRNHEMANAMFEYRKLTAPFDGVVTQRNVDTGHFVQPAAVAKGDALFVVARTDLMRIRVEVPEADADWATAGTAARVRVQVLGANDFAGKVARTSWSLDRTARTLLAEVDVTDGAGRLRPGMYATAVLTAQRPDVLTIPASAVLTEGDVNQGYRTYCFAVEDGKAKRLVIEIGVRDSEHLEVLKRQTPAADSGFPGKWEPWTGQEEIVASAGGVSEGQPVTPTGGQ
jgi:HlyD family secretion protein